MSRSPMGVIAAGIAATILFYLMVHLLAGVWLDLTLRPEVREVIEESLEDQKTLRRLDPEHARDYRERFERNQELLNSLDVILLNRERVLRRFEILLVGVFVLTILTGSIVWWRRQRASEIRARSEYVDRLRSWQEASRRHAHEIRTPLTAARMELERLVAAAERGELDTVRETSGSVFEEFDRIASFTREFSSFATVAQPTLDPRPVGEILTEFRDVFDRAWPDLKLVVESAPDDVSVLCDRDLLRQVLVNLATNSARAVDGAGTLTLAAHRHGDLVMIDVTDTGSGIPAGIRPRIFEPYVTTREVGEGMGLGLPISRKILLDHGGDLQLLRTSPEGTTFRLVLRAA